ncbi:hypothetical protein VM1G_01933 [Cytospora mali]|uniref:Uncharacterized protein n=1 Tax=Cytospora mali TaxID=578113 RepID=A0A194VRY4_CYTMA|nr:hypothetical protein VM1G_01933 [Valsa mali]
MGPYPGLGLPLRHWPQVNWRASHLNRSYPNGAHPNIMGSDSDLLPVREVAMMSIMDRLTDKKDWHKKVFDDAILEKWREEAMAIPDEEFMKIAAAPQSLWSSTTGWRKNNPPKVKDIMSKDAFDYCIQELRSKARHFEETGIIPTLDASASIVKSDVLVKDDLRDSLRQAFQKLQDDQADNPDWHPGSDNMVQDLIHPSMYPLIYGRSKAFEDEVVGVSDAVEKWAGKGNVIEKDGSQLVRMRWPKSGLGGSDVPPSFWSNTYQWLPSNVAFQEDGSVGFTSYINNLHPNKYPDIYSTIEKLIETALPAWDHCLLVQENHNKYGPGRKGSRFLLPEDADDEIMENWDPPFPEKLENADVDLGQTLNPTDENEDEDEDLAVTEEEDEAEVEDEDEEARKKWVALRIPVLREPAPFVDIEYSPYKIAEGLRQTGVGLGGERAAPALKGSLRENFKDLQIIVKAASIELTPENPEFPAGGWHIEGQLNESICATALYYLDSENITDSSLSFRMQTSYDQYELQNEVGQDSYHWLECFYGTSFDFNGACIQNYGRVDTPEGRLLAFPNVFQHQVSPFRLTDPTKPGHRRFIALWLVDPFRRIVSTANVPPQQQDWWTESVFGKSEDSQKSAADKLPAELVQLLQERGVDLPKKSEGCSLPPELLDLVREELGLHTISQKEAEEHRLKLMEERSSHQYEAHRVWTAASYSFCEH